MTMHHHHRRADAVATAAVVVTAVAATVVASVAAATTVATGQRGHSGHGIDGQTGCCRNRCLEKGDERLIDC